MSSTEHLKNQKGFAVFEVVLLLVVLAILGFVGYRAYKSSQAAETNPPSAAGITRRPDPTKGWKTYTNATYAYSFKYPPDWTIKSSNFDGQINVEVHDPSGETRFDFLSVYGIDCNPGDGDTSSFKAITKTFEIGARTVDITEFACIEHTYDFLVHVDTATKKGLEIDVFADKYEKELRLILKSVKGLKAVRTLDEEASSR